MGKSARHPRPPRMSTFKRRLKPCGNCGAPKERGQQFFCLACDNDDVRRARVTESKRRNKARVAALARAEREGTPLAERKRVWHSDVPEGLRWCSCCKSLKAAERFAKTSRYCRVCESAKNHSRRIKRRFQLSVARYDELLERQGGRCAICLRKPRSMRLAVDHDHACCPGEETCGKCVRGLLCKSCNKDLLGTVRDDIGTLERAIDYLRQPPAQQIERAA